MNKKEVIDNSIKDLEKEKEWILLESKYIKKLKKAVKIRSRSRVKVFERKASRAESRINQFEERLLESINLLRENFPEWNKALFEIEEKLKLYNGNILKKVSYVDGTIIKLIKKEEGGWDLINDEIDFVMDKGVRPLIVLLDHLKKELNKISERLILKHEAAIESSLNKRSFIIPFHSANEKEFVNNVLFVRRSLPEYYLGRRIEYAFEVDFFWIEHTRKVLGEKKTKISVFFGHAPHGMTPRNAKKLLGMRHGQTSAENLLKRKGLLLPKWMLSRMGKIRLWVEIKSGWGSDTRALDELVRLVKSYHLEDRIIFGCFAAWPLKYLKKRLPNALTITNIIRIPLLGRLNLPLNRPLQSLWNFGLFIKPSGFKDFIDGFLTPSKNSEKAVIKQIRKTTEDGFYFFGGKVSTKEKLDWLIKHGQKVVLHGLHPRMLLVG